MPSYLPQLPGAQADDELASSKQHLEFIYKPRDGRKVQSLDPVFTLDDLRRSGALGARGGLRSSLAYPGLSPNFLNEPLDGVTSDDDRDDDDLDLYGDGGSSEASGGRGARGKAPPRSPSPDQVAKGGLDMQRYNATAAARATMLHEKPAVVERMEKGVTACAVMRDNRHFRLLSLGVFQPGVNEVRTRSMHRVELHKHLSSTNLRAPQGDKEVRSAVQHDNVGARLERMYNRVLRSMDESAPPSPGLGGVYVPPGAATTTGRRAQLAQGQAQGQQAMLTELMGRAPAFNRSFSSTFGPGRANPPSPNTTTISFANSGGGASAVAVGGASGGGAAAAAAANGRPLLVSIPSMIRQAGGGAYNAAGSAAPHSPPQQQPGSPVSGARDREQVQGPQKTVQSSDYWMRVTLPPEVIEAQLRHLAATTEANLKAYHDRVAAAQDAVLQSNGLGVEALSMDPEQVEQRLKLKLGQIQEVNTVNSNNYSSLNREAVLASHLSTASKELLTAASLPQFIRAALDHVQQHRGELNKLRSANRDEGRHRSMRRRARNKPAATGATAVGALTGMDGGGADSARMYGSSDSARTTASGATDGASAQENSRGSEGSSDTSFWPSYYSVRQRPASAGGPGATPPADPTLLHLEHLRRHASPEPGSGPQERRWSPPPPAMAPNSNSRLTTAAMPLAAAASGGLGAMAPSAGRLRTEVVIDDVWLRNFRDQLEDVEDATPDSPPEGLQPLCPLPPGDMDAGTYVRSRLQRLWTVLDMPATMQLDLVLAFTGRDRALLFARHLELWEQAAAAVLGREAQVEALVAVQRDIEAGNCGRLSLSHVAGLCQGVLRHTRWLEVLSARLMSECGWALSYHGKPYPGEEAITPSHLMAFMEHLRQASQGTAMKP